MLNQAGRHVAKSWSGSSDHAWSPRRELVLTDRHSGLDRGPARRQQDRPQGPSFINITVGIDWGSEWTEGKCPVRRRHIIVDVDGRFKLVTVTGNCTRSLEPTIHGWTFDSQGQTRRRVMFNGPDAFGRKQLCIRYSSNCTVSTQELSVNELLLGTSAD